MVDDTVIYLDNASVNNESILILEAVHMVLNRGEFSYLIGKTGSGKSSLMKLLYGGQVLSSGHGKVLSFDLKNLKLDELSELRKSLGIVLQDFNLFDSWSVLENLEFVLKATEWNDTEKMNARVKEVLEEVGLLDKIDQKVYQLSGGEKQRLVIGRAILNYPKLILADEPTGSLDPQSADDILYLLQKIARTSGTAVLLATHNYRFLEKFPARVYECIGGTIVEKN